jgi:phosphate transport system permease protein
MTPPVLEMTERPALLAPPGKTADSMFRALTFFMAMIVLALVGVIAWKLFAGSNLAIKKFGWRFFTGSNWDPVNNDFGALPFIFGTVASSLIGLVIAVPLSIGAAIYLAELAPTWIRQPVVSLVEMIASIPSVIIGLWGMYVMVPWMRDHPFRFLNRHFGAFPFFHGPVYGFSVLAAGIIIAIMIVPIITSICREVFQSVPGSRREAAYALGATRWEVTQLAVLRGSRRGIIGAAILGLGRALGETMAVTMVIGNQPQIPSSLFAPGATLASALANEFSEANTDLYWSALFELGLVLLLVTILTNTLARALMRTSKMFGPPSR